VRDEQLHPRRRFETAEFRWSDEIFHGLPLVSQMTLQIYGSAIAGLASTLPEQEWHLKGTTALIAYLGPRARLPRDLDVSIGAKPAAALLHSDQLRSVTGTDIAVARAERVRFTDSQNKPLVYRMLLRVGSGDRALGDVLANVLVVSDAEALADQRINLVTFPDLQVAVPAARLGRCLAQKLLRYTRRRSGGRVNTRWSDLFDFLIAASSPATDGLGALELRNDVDMEFANMARSTPSELPEPPAEWLDYWDAEMLRTGAQFGQLSAAAAKLSEFWNPVLDQFPPEARWNPTTWSWQ
jgi:Nucleotidyl transferase AbiEii toxin, Type IV TA system